MANNDGDTLKVHEKIVATEDLPGIPAGTTGRVTLRNGFRWERYRAAFDNGAEYGPIERSQLARRKDWEREQEQRARDERDRRAAEIANSVIPG